MEKEIILDYMPELTLDRISDILKKRFPEYEQSKQCWCVQGPFLRLKKSLFVHACVFVKQQSQEKRTMIGINGNMSPWAVYCFGIVFHYLLRGSFLADVEKVLIEEFSESGM